MNTRLSKMVSILAIVSLLTAGSALAQNRQSNNDWQKGPPTAEEKLARISAALNLNGDQSQEMLRLLQDERDKRAALHEQTMMLMGPEICAQRAEHEEAMLAILDPDQTELFLQMKEHRQANQVNANKRNRNGSGMVDCPN